LRLYVACWPCQSIANVAGASEGFSTRRTMEPSGLRKATCSRGDPEGAFSDDIADDAPVALVGEVPAEVPAKVDSMRNAPGSTNLLTCASAVKSTVGVTVAGFVE